MEPTSHCFETLARHLRNRSQPVTLINSYAVKENRNQKMMHHEKDNEIDLEGSGRIPLQRGLAGCEVRLASCPKLLAVDPGIRESGCMKGHVCP